MATLDKVFNTKLTENGDLTHFSTGNNLIDILFKTEYYRNHTSEIPRMELTEQVRLFSMFIRDPRFGVGQKNIGRELFYRYGITPELVVKAGSFKDLFYNWKNMSDKQFTEIAKFLEKECRNGNELAKKWAPRFSRTKEKALASKVVKTLNLTRKEYRKLVKNENTTEYKLTFKETDRINFSQVPSLAMIKYFNRFANKEDTKERFAQYLQNVKSGKADLKISTTTVYDIYKNRTQIDPDLFFDKIEKISGSWIPVVDTSGSMLDANDSFGKACAIGHYLAKCSTYAPNTVLSFSSAPQLIILGHPCTSRFGYSVISDSTSDSTYIKEIASMYTGDCSDTNFAAVCNKLKELGTDAPEFIIVLSDQEFNCGSSTSKDEMMELFKKNGMNTKLVWWNFNSRAETCPETDDYGNIFLSGYNPMLLQYLEAGFDGKQFLNKLLETYKEKVEL